MKKYFLIALISIFISLFSFNVYAQDNIDQQKNSDNVENPNIMEVVLFLNCNMLPPGAASYKIDEENKIVRYFDKDGILMEEHFLDKDNVIVYKKYDKSGNIIVEKRLTEEDIKNVITQYPSQKNEY